MGSRPLRMKVRWGCPPRVLSPPPHRTQSWRPCLPRQPWASDWRSTDRPVPSPRGWTIGFCPGAFLPGGAWGADEFVDGPFHGQKPLVRLLRPHYPRWRSGQGVRGHSPGGESGRGALVPTKRRHLEEPSSSPVRLKLTAALAAKAYSAAGQAAPPCTPWLSCRFTKPRRSNRCTRVVPTRGGDAGAAHGDWLRSTSDESHGAGPSEGDVHHGGPGAPSLAQPGRDEGRRQGTLPRPPISQGGLFGDTVEGFAQQSRRYSSRRGDPAHPAPAWCTIHRCPRARPQSARRRGRPPASSRAAPPQAESTHRPVRRASRRRAAPPASQPGPKSSRNLRVLNRALHKLRSRCWRTGAWSNASAPGLVCSDRPEGRFLRFAFEGRAWQYRVLPFGLSLSPRVFTKVVEGALTPLREVGVRILNYLDDWLILAQSKEQLGYHRDLVLWHLSQLGLRVNWEKSKLSPVQRISFLGVELDSVSMTACLIGGTCPSSAELPEFLQRQECGTTETVSEAPGAYGIRSCSHAARIASYETTSALATLPGPEVGMAPRYTASRYLPAVSPLPQPWTDLAFPGILLSQQMPPARAGALHATGRQPRGSGQGPDCFGTSTAWSCGQCI